MVSEAVSKILNELTVLLDDVQSPHSISFQFERIAVLLDQAKLPVEKIDCKEYYDDEELSLILTMKNEALANGQFELASKFRFIEAELLLKKGNNKFTQLKIEQGFFEYRNSCVIFHFNTQKENERLIANLIEGYNIIHKNADSHKMLYC